MDSCQPIRKETKMEIVHFNQRQLAARWRISEATLERWRSAGLGPKFLKLCGRVLYRQVDIETYEESCLATSTSSRVAHAAPTEFSHDVLLQPLDQNWRQRVRSLIDGVEENPVASSAEHSTTDFAGTNSGPNATPVSHCD
jgi:hypothetical protein